MISAFTIGLAFLIFISNVNFKKTSVTNKVIAPTIVEEEDTENLPE
ncbi:MAG: hypothetical protein ACNFW9_05110 [Candidatus Kerfeldbacteria bacterium]|jgi:hypothetical protein